MILQKNIGNIINIGEVGVYGENVILIVCKTSTV